MSLFLGARMPIKTMNQENKTAGTTSLTENIRDTLPRTQSGKVDPKASKHGMRLLAICDYCLVIKGYANRPSFFQKKTFCLGCKRECQCSFFHEKELIKKADAPKKTRKKKIEQPKPLTAAEVAKFLAKDKGSRKQAGNMFNRVVPQKPEPEKPEFVQISEEKTEGTIELQSGEKIGYSNMRADVDVSSTVSKDKTPAFMRIKGTVQKAKIELPAASFPITGVGGKR